MKPMTLKRKAKTLKPNPVSLIITILLMCVVVTNSSMSVAQIVRTRDLPGVKNQLVAAPSNVNSPIAKPALVRKPQVKFKNADLMEVANVLSRISDKRFIFDGAVRGKTTILSATAITADDLYKAFLHALALNGYSVDEDEGFVRIYSAPSVAKGNSDLVVDPSAETHEKIVSWIYQPKHISATEFQKSFGSITSRYGEMSVSAASNTLVFTDFATSLKRIQRLMNQIDIESKPTEEKPKDAPTEAVKINDEATPNVPLPASSGTPNPETEITGSTHDPSEKMIIIPLAPEQAPNPNGAVNGGDALDKTPEKSTEKSPEKKIELNDLVSPKEIIPKEEKVTEPIPRSPHLEDETIDSLETV